MVRKVIGFLIAVISWWAIPIELGSAEIPNVQYHPHGTLTHSDPRR